MDLYGFGELGAVRRFLLPSVHPPLHLRERLPTFCEGSIVVPERAGPVTRLSFGIAPIRNGLKQRFGEFLSSGLRYGEELRVSGTGLLRVSGRSPVAAPAGGGLPAGLLALVVQVPLHLRMTERASPTMRDALSVVRQNVVTPRTGTRHWQVQVPLQFPEAVT